jgi:hypothetical protein
MKILRGKGKPGEYEACTPLLPLLRWVYAANMESPAQPLQCRCTYAERAQIATQSTIEQCTVCASPVQRRTVLQPSPTESLAKEETADKKE